MEAFMVTLYLMEAIGPPQLLMHLRVQNLAQTWRWPERDFPFKIACHFIPEYYRPLSLVHSFIFFAPPWHLIFSPSMRVFCLALSFSHSSHLPAAILPPHAWFSLPVALQRKFNIGLFGVSKDSIRRTSGHYAKTNISCWGQEQQTSPHYPTMLIFAPLVLSLALF